MPADRPIFLVGCPRSGTTLLSAMLHAHPRIAMPPETRFLMPVYFGRARYGDLTVEENRRKLAARITQRSSRFNDLGLNRRRVTRLIVNGPPTIGSAAGVLWREFARSRGKARWGEKRPAYWHDMDVVLRLFPDAQVVHLVRDGRACIASLKQVDWWDRSTTGSITTWVLADRVLRHVGRKLPADSYHRLRYEDLLADPRGELRALCGFLGEDFDEGMLDFAAAARDIVPDRKSWHDRTKGALDPGRTEAWRTTLEPAELGLFELVAAREMRANGYQLSGAGGRPSALAVARYYGLLARRVAAMARSRVLDAAQRRREGVPLADLGPVRRPRGTRVRSVASTAGGNAGGPKITEAPADGSGP